MARITELNATLMICTFVLWLKFFITTFIQGNKSAKAGTRVKEDKQVAEPTEEDKEADFRWKKIVQNDIEGIQIGLIVLWAARIVAVFPDSILALIILACTFTLFRILHTLVFVLKISIVRSIFYTIANLSVAAAGLVEVIDGFRSISI